MKELTVVLAEDDLATREALAQLLSLEPDIEVVGKANNGQAALQLLIERRPQILLADIDMPVMNGIELTRRAKLRFPEIPVCILTIYHDDANVFEAIKAGATGYLLKDGPIEETAAALRDLAAGGSHLHPGIATRVLAEFNRIARRRAADLQLFSDLTSREIEVLKELATGKRNRDIAESLFISEKTVKNHISSILLKLHVNDRTEAAMIAARGGLIEP